METKPNIYKCVLQKPPETQLRCFTNPTLHWIYRIYSFSCIKQVSKTVDIAHVIFGGQHAPAGIFPDILHICDLQIIPDALSSALLDLLDGVRAKDAALERYRLDYEKWCQENGYLVPLTSFNIV